jgi:hypothetical protein
MFLIFLNFRKFPFNTPFLDIFSRFFLEIVLKLKSTHFDMSGVIHVEKSSNSCFLLVLVLNFLVMTNVNVRKTVIFAVFLRKNFKFIFGIEKIFKYIHSFIFMIIKVFLILCSGFRLCWRHHRSVQRFPPLLASPSRHATAVVTCIQPTMSII